MEKFLKQLNDTNLPDAGKCNGEFIIDSEVVIHLENNKIHCEVVNRSPTTKHYTADIDYLTYINNPDKAVYLAYVDGTVAGEVVLEKHWNNFGFVFYIVVDVAYRGRGIGQALMDRAKKWAREKGLAGLMLETQTNNVAACKFYERCGFEIGGFDKFLYTGDGENNTETAIFWYYFVADHDN